MNKTSTSETIKTLITENGFNACGIASARTLHEEKDRFSSWLSKGLHGEMDYMNNHFEKRIDPQKLIPNAKSVVVAIMNYYTDKFQPDESPVISKYAYGIDYHYVLKQRMLPALEFIRDECGDSDARCFVDSAPVLEKTWGVLSGLGWIGKNTLLLNKQFGSFFFIGVIITTVELNYNPPIDNDYCGTCTKCINSCPTNALIAPRLLDSNKCISYQTIENKKEIPEHLENRLSNRIFGCDICQDVCPWNQKLSKHRMDEFEPHPNLLAMTKTEWNDLSKESYNELFLKSAIKRTKYPKLMQNIQSATKNNS